MKKFKYEIENDNDYYYIFIYNYDEIIDDDTDCLDSYFYSKDSDYIMGSDMRATTHNVQEKLKEPFLTILLAFRI